MTISLKDQLAAAKEALRVLRQQAEGAESAGGVSGGGAAAARVGTSPRALP